MVVRKYRSGDCEQIAQLFFNTVHTVNARDYTPAQLDAWATGDVDLAAWDRSFREHYTVVALDGGMIRGFGDIDNTGYLDRLYVHREYQRRGIGSAVCDLLERAASGTVITHASITARPFFEHRGYLVVREQQIERRGVILTNFVMRRG